jgi:hypothetical protein
MKTQDNTKVNEWLAKNFTWLVAMVVSIMTSYITFTTTIHDITIQNTDQQVRIERLEKDNLDSKIQLTEIKTLLKNVDANITDIKLRLK